MRRTKSGHITSTRSSAIAASVVTVEKRVAGLDLRTQASLTVGSAKGPVVVPHQPRAEPSVSCGLASAATRDAARRREAVGRGRRDDRAVDRGRRVVRGRRGSDGRDRDGRVAISAATRSAPITAGGAAVLGVSTAAPASAPAARRAGATQSDRRVPARGDAGERPGAVAAGRSPHADPPRLSRSAGPAADAAKKSTPSSTTRSPDAWPRLVDRLLASPHYGERWARHWLDLVRYADSGGFEFDVDRPQAWRYRDYVVQAFNDDKPYDRFVREQIAGDEYAPDSDEAMIATGFLRLGPEGGGGGERGRQDALDDVVVDDVAHVHGRDGGVRALPQPQVRSDSAEGLLPHPVRVRLDAVRRTSAGARARGQQRTAPRPSASKRC